MSGLKYQDIETILRQENVSPGLRKIIQHLHAENVGYGQEIKGICRGMDRIIDVINQVLTVATAHNHVFKGMEDGKSFSESLESLRAEHLSGIESEKVE